MTGYSIHDKGYRGSAIVAVQAARSLSNNSHLKINDEDNPMRVILTLMFVSSL